MRKQGHCQHRIPSPARHQPALGFQFRKLWAVPDSAKRLGMLGKENRLEWFPPKIPRHTSMKHSEKTAASLREQLRLKFSDFIVTFFKIMSCVPFAFFGIPGFFRKFVDTIVCKLYI